MYSQSSQEILLVSFSVYSDFITSVFVFLQYQTNFYFNDSRTLSTNHGGRSRDASSILWYIRIRHLGSRARGLGGWKHAWASEVYTLCSSWLVGRNTEMRIKRESWQQTSKRDYATKRIPWLKTHLPTPTSTGKLLSLLRSRRIHYALCELYELGI